MSRQDEPPFDLSKRRAVLTPSMSIRTKLDGPNFYGELDTEFDGFAGHALIAQFSFDKDWGVWECHPKGDELVYLVSGEAELVLHRLGGEEVIRVDSPGQYVVVPCGVWHTARTDTPTTMLFVTPGEGTMNEAAPPTF